MPKGGERVMKLYKQALNRVTQTIHFPEPIQRLKTVMTICD